MEYFFSLSYNFLATVKKYNIFIFWQIRSLLGKLLAPPTPSGTFYGQNRSGDHDSKEYGRERRGRTRSKDRSTSRSRDFLPRTKSPHHTKTRRDSSASPHGSRNQNNRSGSTFISFHHPVHSAWVYSEMNMLDWGVFSTENSSLGPEPLLSLYSLNVNQKPLRSDWKPWPYPA